MDYKGQAGALCGALGERRHTAKRQTHVLRMYVGEQIDPEHRTPRGTTSLCIRVYLYV